MPVTFSSRRHQFLNQLSTVLFWVVHLAVLLVFVVPFSWKLVALAVFGYLIRMWAITAGYHRYFSHRSYKTSRGFQFALAWLGASSMQNGPLWWASWHRRHHKHSDTEHDAHSPKLHGFWHAHAGWFLDGTHDEPDFSNIGDLAKFPELRFVERRKWLPIVSYAVLCFLIAGLPGVVWGFLVSTVALMHATMLINSLAHTHGTRRYATSDTSRNNLWLAILTLGEGWHNNHHHCMTSARQGFYWWEIDVSYWTLRALSAVGVIWDVRLPPPHAYAKDDHRRIQRTLPMATVLPRPRPVTVP